MQLNHSSLETEVEYIISSGLHDEYPYCFYSFFNQLGMYDVWFWYHQVGYTQYYRSPYLQNAHHHFLFIKQLIWPEKLGVIKTVVGQNGRWKDYVSVFRLRLQVFRSQFLHSPSISPTPSQEYSNKSQTKQKTMANFLIKSLAFLDICTAVVVIIFQVRTVKERSFIGDLMKNF